MSVIGLVKRNLMVVANLLVHKELLDISTLVPRELDDLTWKEGASLSM